jgi:hypothetical protein
MSNTQTKTKQYVSIKIDREAFNSVFKHQYGEHQRMTNKEWEKFVEAWDDDICDWDSIYDTLYEYGHDILKKDVRNDDEDDEDDEDESEEDAEEK